MINLKKHLKEFKLSGIYNSIDERIKYAMEQKLSYSDFLEILLEDESNNRKDNNLRKRMKTAKFPNDKNIEEFNFDFQPSIDQREINDALTCQFIEQKSNIVFLGDPGTGKSHLSISIARHAVIKGYKVIFTSVSEMLQQLHASKADNSYYKKIKIYTNCDLLVLDELGFTSLPNYSVTDFFDVITKCYENISLIITSNKEVDLWPEIFADKTITSAIIDRIKHHCKIFKITGNSYRTSNTK